MNPSARKAMLRSFLLRFSYQSRGKIHGATESAVSQLAPPLLSLGHHPRFHERSAKSGLRCEPPPDFFRQVKPPSFTPNSPGNKAESSLKGQSALPRVAAALHKAHGSTSSTGSTPSAGHRMGRGKGALASPLRLQRTTSTPTYAGRCARLRLKNQRGQLGAPGVLHDSRGHEALQAGGLRALSQRLLAAAVAAQRLQSLHAARKGLPHRRHVVQLAGAGRQPAAAQGALAVLRGQGLLPLRRAGHFSSFRKISCAKPARHWPLYSCPSASHHLSDPGAPPQPQPAVLRRAAALGRSPAAMSWRRSSHQNRVRGVEAPPLLDGRQGLPRLAPVPSARRQRTWCCLP